MSNKNNKKPKYILLLLLLLLFLVIVSIVFTLRLVFDRTTPIGVVLPSLISMVLVLGLTISQFKKYFKKD